MHAAIKLLTGLAATVVIARGAEIHAGPDIMAQLGAAAATAMAAHGVTDGSVRFRGPDRFTGRRLRLSGTADAATRAAIIADLQRHPGIQDARWARR